MRRMRPVCPVLIAAMLCLPVAAIRLFGAQAVGIIDATGRDLQQVIDAAPSNAVVHCDANQTLTLSTPVTIRKPLTLVGLHARLPEKLGETPLVIVEAKGVAVTDFELI